MKTKLTPELQDKICGYISKGNYIETSCAAVGVDKKTYYRWLERAEKDGDDTIYSHFSHAIKTAEGEAQVLVIGKIRELGAKNWQAWGWIAERRWSKDWSQVSRGTLEVDITHKVVNIAEIARKYDSPPEIEGEFKELKDE